MTQLARNGDVLLRALHQASCAPPLVPDRSRDEYCRYRTDAIRSALRGSLADAHAVLDSGWASGRVGSADQAADLALIHLSAGEPKSALQVLTLSLRTPDGLTDRARRLFLLTTLIDPRLFRPALRAALRHGNAASRIRLTATLIRARLRPPLPK